MHYILMHLPTAQIVASGWYIEEVEDFLELNFFYEDPTTQEIMSKPYELGDVEYVTLNKDTNERIGEPYFLIKLNKCEFEVMEVEYGSKTASFATGSGDYH